MEFTENFEQTEVLVSAHISHDTDSERRTVLLTSQNIDIAKYVREPRCKGSLQRRTGETGISQSSIRKVRLDVEGTTALAPLTMRIKLVALPERTRGMNSTLNFQLYWILFVFWGARRRRLRVR